MNTHRSRRNFMALTAPAIAGLAHANPSTQNKVRSPQKAQIAISFDLEMSRNYPKRGMTEWDYEKGNLNQATKDYSLQAAKVAKERGQPIQFFCVGRTLEQANVDWLKEIIDLGHPLGNHTYDHINVFATTPEKIQLRFQRSPWLIAGKRVEQVIRENIEMTTVAMKKRLGITPNGFRTASEAHHGLDSREDIQKMVIDFGFPWVSSKYPSHRRFPAGSIPTEADFDMIVDTLSDAQPYVYPSDLVEIPMSPITDVVAFRAGRWKLDQFLTAVQRSVEWAIENGQVYDFQCHPSIMYVEDPEHQTVKLICDLVKKAGPDKAEIVGLSEIAEATKKTASLP